MPGMTNPKTGAQAEMLANRLIKRYRHLRKWARRVGAGVYRLYDRDIPEIPLVLDLYSGEGPGGQAAVSGALYQRPYDKNETEEAAWLHVMRAAIAGALEIPQAEIYLKERRRLRNRQEGPAQCRRQDTAAGTGPQDVAAGTGRTWREIREGGLRFRVNLSDYLDTGLFPDRRLLRAQIQRKAPGKRVLNLFCYTGSFSVYAAAGGAAAVDSVDMSNTYLDWAAQNFGLNTMTARRLDTQGFFARSGGGRSPAPPLSLIRADVLRFLDEAQRASRGNVPGWDLIMLDPPTFSNSKKMSGTLDIRRDHRELIGRCLPLLSPGGVLYFSSNARGFRLDRESLERFPNFGITDLGPGLVDEDFRGKRPPACYLFQRDAP
jgi:23S rRNA G2069 N7-methylase RlmK/C1962 C5-methylase RlmI